MKRALFMCLVVFPMLAACGDPGGGGEDNNANNDPSSCEGSLPNGSVDVAVTGSETVSASYTLDCGVPSGDYGILPTHAPIRQGDPVRLQVAFNEGQDWVLFVTTELETFEPGSYALTPSPDENHGYFNTPVGPDEDFYDLNSGTLEITDVETLTLATIEWAIIDGSVTANLDSLTATVTFENLPVRVFPGE